MGPVAAQYPLIVGEIGEGDCSHNFIDPLMTWLDSIHARYLPDETSADDTCKQSTDKISFVLHLLQLPGLDVEHLELRWPVRRPVAHL